MPIRFTTVFMLLLFLTGCSDKMIEKKICISPVTVLIPKKTIYNVPKPVILDGKVKILKDGNVVMSKDTLLEVGRVIKSLRNIILFKDMDYALLSDNATITNELNNKIIEDNSNDKKYN